MKIIYPPRYKAQKEDMLWKRRTYAPKTGGGSLALRSQVPVSGALLESLLREHLLLLLLPPGARLSLLCPEPALPRQGAGKPEGTGLAGGGEGFPPKYSLPWQHLRGEEETGLRRPFRACTGEQEEQQQCFRSPLGSSPSASSVHLQRNLFKVVVFSLVLQLFCHQEAALVGNDPPSKE